ncbi:SGNH/GDSL hydrolase family protein [Mobilitalea sibirica]|uniref:SGNH/GDSL hydrolase family protein n=1 Tax=Mobilitalea sibirica TaxID=1462919 RepID=UPI002ED207F9
MLGDSITYGYGVDHEEAYASLLMQESYIESIQNLGINGSTLGKGQDPISERYTSVEDDADIIMIYAGTNDYGSTFNPVPIGDKGDKNNGTFYGALHVLYEGLMTQYPNTKPIFVTMLKRNDVVWGRPETTPYNSLGFTMDEYYHVLIDFYKSHRIDYIDIYQHEELNALNLDLCNQYFMDGLHPNKQGHAVLKDAIADGLKKIIGLD